MVTCLEFRVNTFSFIPRHLNLAALGNLDGLLRLVARPLFDILDGVNNVVTLENLAEDHMLAIQPGGNSGSDKELQDLVCSCKKQHKITYLGPIGVLPRVSHAKLPLLGVLELKVLVREFCTIDGLSASS